MQFVKRFRISPSMIVACVALFVALGGTGYAALTITGANIKNGSIKGVDISKNAINSSKVANGSLKATDFRAGQLPSGPQGPQGPAGPQGAQGPPGVAGYQIVFSQTFTVAGNSRQYQQSVSCPAGKKVLSGGAVSDTISPGMEIGTSAPTGIDGGGWLVSMDNLTASPQTWRVYAVCATVS